MYLQLAENEYLSKRSRSERKAARQEKRSAFRSKAQERRERIKRAFYVPIRKNGRIIHVREDLFDDLPENEYDEAMNEAEEIEEMMESPYLSESHYLSAKADRAARRAARQERKERRQEAKTQRKEGKVARQEAKTDVVRARAEGKRTRAEAKRIKAETGGGGSWVDDLTDVAGAVGGVVGAFKGQPQETGDYEDGGEVTRTAELMPEGAGALPEKPKSNTTKYLLIGGGLLAAGLIIFLIAKPKKNR